MRIRAAAVVAAYVVSECIGLITHQNYLLNPRVAAPLLHRLRSYSFSRGSPQLIRCHLDAH